MVGGVWERRREWVVSVRGDYCSSEVERQTQTDSLQLAPVTCHDVSHILSGKVHAHGPGSSWLWEERLGRENCFLEAASVSEQRRGGSSSSSSTQRGGPATNGRPDQKALCRWLLLLCEVAHSWLAVCETCMLHMGAGQTRGL